MEFRLWIILCSTIYGMVIKGAFSNYQWENYPQSFNSGYSTNNYNNRYQYNAKRLPPETSKTEYGFQTVQKETVHILPRQKGPPIIQSADKETKNYFVTTNQTTFYIPSKLNRSISYNPTPLQRHRRPRADCVKCPPEKIVIARKGLDGVLVEPPKLISCRNRPLSNATYQVETLFGPDFQFLLSQGSHAFHGKIQNKRSGKHLKTCTLRYKVIVQQCGHYYPQNENLKVKCDIGYIWGSKCHFTCRIGYLSHKRPVICGDSFQWEGDEPECLTSPPIDNQKKSCDFLGIPDNGRFSCEYPKGANNNYFQNELTIPEGSICKVVCDINYEIPEYLEPYSTLRCENSKWNATANSLCRPRLRQRY